MTPERWAQTRQIFEGALDRAEKDRAAYLRITCAGDEELRREVEALLHSHDGSGDFLDKPAAEIAKGCPCLLTGGKVEVRPLEGFRLKS